MQDPVFNRLDEEFLQSLGYTTLPIPESFEKLTFKTFLFAPHLEWPIYIQALRIATPGLCIGNSVGEFLDSVHGPQDSEELKIRETLQEFSGKTESVEMPAFDRATWCMSTSVYWRKDSEKGEATDNDIAENLKTLELED